MFRADMESLQPTYRFASIERLRLHKSVWSCSYVRMGVCEGHRDVTTKFSLARRRMFVQVLDNTSGVSARQQIVTA